LVYFSNVLHIPNDGYAGVFVQPFYTPTIGASAAGESSCSSFQVLGRQYHLTPSEHLVTSGRPSRYYPVLRICHLRMIPAEINAFQSAGWIHKLSIQFRDARNHVTFPWRVFVDEGLEDRPIVGIGERYRLRMPHIENIGVRMTQPAREGLTLFRRMPFTPGSFSSIAPDESLDELGFLFNVHYDIRRYGEMSAKIILLSDDRAIYGAAYFIRRRRTCQPIPRVL